MTDKGKTHKYTKISHKYTEYAENILSGQIIAGEAIKLACQRYLDWFDRDDLYFDSDKVDKVVNFIGKMKHFEAPFENQPFILQDWQFWIICNIFGWINKETNERQITDVYMLISRKCGKSSLSAAICLAELWLEGEGSEVYNIATTKDQAKVCFKYCSGFARSLDPKEKYMKRYRDTVKNTYNHSILKALAANPERLDGLNCNCFIWDEVAAAQDYECYNILKSSQSMRKNPLSICITSANFLLDGYPGYEMMKTGLQILRNQKTDDSWFYAMYMLDDEDDWKDEKVWKKACPSLGITVKPSFLKQRVQQAINTPSLEPDVRTKQFNQFVSNRNNWIPGKFIDNAFKEVIDLNKLKDEYCYCGIDLSSVSDLTAVSLMFPPNEERTYYPNSFIFKTLIYVPRIAMENAPNKYLYNQFMQYNALRITPTNAVDYDTVLKDLLEIANNVQIIKCGYDQWNSVQFTKDAEQYLTMEKFSQGLGNFNIGTKEIERLFLEGKIVVDKNPIIRWMFNNCEIKQDYMGNSKPIKYNDDDNNKIDGVIAMIEALGTWLKDNEWYFGEEQTDQNNV